MKKSYITFKLLLALFLVTQVLTSYGQQRKTQNVIAVTIDGARWLEAFKGADSVLLNNPEYNKKFAANIKKKFWAPTAEERRMLLMPFLWTEVVQNGRIYGNRDLGSNVQVKNLYNVSYPGYSEIYTGYPDPEIKSNAAVLNPNPNVLEFINKQHGFEGKVASFISWNAADFYLNEKRSGFLVNSGYEPMEGKLSPMQETLNHIQNTWPITVTGSSRPDAITYHQAKEYMRLNHPRVMTLGFAYTDDHAHAGEYGLYLEQIHAFDAYLADLWKTVQSDPFYKDKTSILITIDHGRGYGDGWKSHGPNVEHANEIWFAVMGPDIKPMGEMKNTSDIYQNQFAQTMAHFLGLDFKSSKPIGPVISELTVK